jgi:hypothetical protein
MRIMATWAQRVHFYQKAEAACLISVFNIATLTGLLGPAKCFCNDKY